MASKRKSLGRGLDALLGSSPRKPLTQPAAGETAGTAHAAVAGESNLLRELPVDLLQRGRYQPRVDMRQDTLEELAASIKAQGVVQPIAVRPLTNAAGGEQRYEIIAGERRWRAAQLAGLSKIPAVINDVKDADAVAIALIENIQREDLNPLEEARALSRLIEEFELTHQLASEAVGRSRAAVSNLLRLLDLSEDVQTLLEGRKLDMGHARALLGVTSARDQIALAREVVAKKLTVRDTERRVRELNAPAKKKPAPAKKDPNIAKLENDVSEKLGAKVEVKHTSKGSGSIVIDYNSLDELDGILSHIK